MTTAPQFVQHAGVPGGTPLESAAPPLSVGGGDVNTAGSAAPGHFVPVSELTGAAAVAPPIAGLATSNSLFMLAFCKM